MRVGVVLLREDRGAAQGPFGDILYSFVIFTCAFSILLLLLCVSESIPRGFSAELSVFVRGLSLN